MKKYKLLYPAFYYLFILLSCLCCKAQKTPALTQDTINYFNIDKYKDWEIDTNYTNYAYDKYFKKKNQRANIYYSYENNYYSDKDSVDLSKLKLKQIEEFTSIENSLYKTIRFYYPNGNLKMINKQFDGMNIGTRKNYDEQGKLVEEINYDKPYKFTLDQLITKMKREYNLDLLNGKGLFVSRAVSKKGNIENPYYEVTVRLNPNIPELGYTAYLIDGITGKTLLIKEQNEEMGYEADVWGFYLKQLEKRKNSSSPIYKTYKGRDFTREEWEQFIADDFYSYRLTRDTLEYFTLDKYKNWEINYRFESTQFDKFFKKDNRRVQIHYVYKNNPYSDRDSVNLSQSELEEIIEYTVKINSSFVTIRYYYPNGSLKTKLYKFNYMDVGTERNYDEQGKLVKEINYDEPYKFTLEQLIAKMKQEYHIDLLKVELMGYNVQTDVTRSLSKKGTMEEYPSYEVRVRKKSEMSKAKYKETEYTTYLVDGITGEILSIKKEQSRIESM